MKQLRRQNAQGKSLNRIPGPENNLLDLQNIKELQKNKKEKIALLKM